MKKYSPVFFALAGAAAIFLIAAKPSGITGFTSMWVGDQTATSDVTVGDDDAYIHGSLEVDGAVRFDGQTKTVHLPLADFMDVTAGIPTAIGTSSNIPVIGWVDGVTTKSSQTFMIPNDYTTGGVFKTSCWGTVAGVNRLDYEVYVNTSGSAFDTSVTDQAPVTINNITTTGIQTLSVATDTFAAYDFVTFRMVREDGGSTGTGAVYCSGVVFEYQ